MDDLEVKFKMDSDSDTGTKSGADLKSGVELKSGLDLKVYKKRWWVLFGLSLLNFCGALVSFGCFYKIFVEFEI